MSDRSMSNLGQHWPLAIAATVTIVVSVGYSMLILTQGTEGLTDAVPVFVNGYLVLLAIASGTAAFTTGQMASSAAAVATGGLLALGFLGMFSIGLPLMVAAAFAAWGYAKTRGAAAHSAWQDAVAGFATAATSLALLVLP